MGQQIHPAIAAELRKLDRKFSSLNSQITNLNMALDAERKQREQLEKKSVHIDDMPGKQLPFHYQINIAMPAGSSSPSSGTVTVSRDGPFIARRMYASCIVTDAPVLTTNSGAVTWDFSHFENRFIPISSRPEYARWGFSNMYDSPTGVRRSYQPPVLDFEWEYNDGGSERNRQDKAISGDILARFDEDGYFMNNEIFAAGTTISFRISPLRAPVVTVYDIDNDDEASGNVALLFKVTLDGFKVLQPLEL